MHTVRGPFSTMPLHRDVGIEVIKRSISLLAAIPTTLIHPLDLLVTPPWALMLLGTGNWYE